MDKEITRFTNRQTGHGENSTNYFLNCIFLPTGDRLRRLCLSLRSQRNAGAE